MCRVGDIILIRKYIGEDGTRQRNHPFIVLNGVKKDGFIKANQIHYFQKDKLDYIVVGSVTPELFAELMKLIEELFLRMKKYW